MLYFNIETPIVTVTYSPKVLTKMHLIKYILNKFYRKDLEMCT